MQLKYRAGIGKIVWAMTTCRPDIAFTSVKLSQSNSAPAEHHYHGNKHAIRYVYIIRDNGIYFWRTCSRPELPEGNLPSINSNHKDLLLEDHLNHDAAIAVAYGDSNWATCVKTRCSFSGICIQSPRCHGDRPGGDQRTPACGNKYTMRFNMQQRGNP